MPAKKKATRKKATASGDLEARVAKLEQQILLLAEAIEACCDTSGPGPGRPCRGGRPIIVSGYEITSPKHGNELLSVMFGKPKGGRKKK